MTASVDGRRSHPIADAIGACIRGYRMGDQATQKNVRSWFKLLGGGGLAIYVAFVAVQDWRAQAASAREESIRQAAALVEALKEQTHSIGELVTEIRNDRATRDQDHAVIMERLGTQRRAVRRVEPVGPFILPSPSEGGLP